MSLSFESFVGWINRFLSRVFGSHNQRVIKRVLPVIEQINELEKKYRGLPDAAFPKMAEEFRARLKKHDTLDDILPEVFAATREASRRSIGLRHYDVQLIGGWALHNHMIAEMVTGEGKTLVATTAAALNALEGNGVHVITVNDYLARRDAQWMGAVYEMLGLTVGIIQHDYQEAYRFDSSFLNDPQNKMRCLRPCTRKEAYSADITYGTNNNYGFDYLRDNMKSSLEQQVQRYVKVEVDGEPTRKLPFAIIDEADNILIDEARTPLIISGPAEESAEKYAQADRVARRLEAGVDYEVKEKEHIVMMTEAGIEKAQRLLGVEDFYTGDNLEWPHLLEQALKAHSLYRADKEYVVKEGEVIIVDEFTGRMMPGRRWSDGLHQAVEAKEGIRIREESQTLATITLQNYFKLYKKLAGMTGTASTEAMELDKIYNLQVLTIPTNRPLIRDNKPDIVYRTKKEKWDAVADEICRVHETGRPILVGTTSIENSEIVSTMLKRRGVKHEVLNAKYHEKEAQIVARAGERSTVTIATNMAGRGTDIILEKGVADIGGLHVLGTERHEARRIDLQLRGRCGRQGDPGSSQFFLALEDDLMRIFAPEWVSNILLRLGMTEGEPIESTMVSNAIARAQKKMEDRNFEIRKNLVEYDKVMNEQRHIIYGQRQDILEGKDMRAQVVEMLEERVDEVMDRFLPQSAREDWDVKALAEFVKTRFDVADLPADIGQKPDHAIREELLTKVMGVYEAKEKEIGADNMRQLERYLLLMKIDEKWKDHLFNMDQLRSGIGLRSYAQLDPKIQYKKEGYEQFEGMLASIKEEVTDLLLKVQIQREDQERLRKQAEAERLKKATESKADATNAAARAEQAGGQGGPPPDEKPKPYVANGPKVGRNDPCYCGSGKKFKKCHGKKAAPVSGGGETEEDEDEKD
ncbi:MAG: preprotein translocase subunit SecA [Planctomycetia bacterium]|nr:preprotein translocase subunit SecA [Planctomycetia bacterium]